MKKRSIPNQKRILPLIGSLAILVLTVACSKEVTLSATPGILCGGGPVTLNWQVTGHDGYELSWIGGILQQNFSGNQTVNVQQTSTFTVTGYKGISPGDKDSVTVQVGLESRSTTLTLEMTSCVGQTATYQTNLPASDFASGPFPYVPNELLKSVKNENSRALTIIRSNQTSVPAGGTTNFFNGQSPLGTWTVTASLASGEVCPDSGDVGPPKGNPPPDTMELFITFGCSP
jgi:hypothetical protein